jgi:hypothetical protein
MTKSDIFENLNKFSDERSENFESLVDVFTLLSFVLIIVAILFSSQKLQRSAIEQQGIFIFKEITEGTGAPSDLPLNTIVVILTIENFKDVIYLVKSGEMPKIIFQSGQKRLLWESLEDLKSFFLKSEDIQIVVDNKNQSVNAELFLILQNWLARYSLKSTINFQGRTNEK